MIVYIKKGVVFVCWCPFVIIFKCSNLQSHYTLDSNNLFQRYWSPALHMQAFVENRDIWCNQKGLLTLYFLKKVLCRISCVGVLFCIVVGYCPPWHMWTVLKIYSFWSLKLFALRYLFNKVSRGIVQKPDAVCIKLGCQKIITKTSISQYLGILFVLGSSYFFKVTENF